MVSIGAILSIAGIKDALIATPAPVVGVSPIIGGAAVRGMADACLKAIGVPTTAKAVGLHYAELIDGWLIDEVDAADALDLLQVGLKVDVGPLWMSSPEATARIAERAMNL